MNSFSVVATICSSLTSLVVLSASGVALVWCGVWCVVCGCALCVVRCVFAVYLGDCDPFPVHVTVAPFFTVEQLLSVLLSFFLSFLSFSLFTAPSRRKEQRKEGIHERMNNAGL